LVFKRDKQVAIFLIRNKKLIKLKIYYIVVLIEFNRIAIETRQGNHLSSALKWLNMSFSKIPATKIIRLRPQ
jgi:hypothetical protein